MWSADNSPQGAQKSLPAGPRVALAAWHGDWARDGGCQERESPGGKVTRQGSDRWHKGLKAGTLL